MVETPPPDKEPGLWEKSRLKLCPRGVRLSQAGRSAAYMLPAHSAVFLSGCCRTEGTKVPPDFITVTETESSLAGKGSLAALTG